MLRCHEAADAAAGRDGGGGASPGTYGLGGGRWVLGLGVKGSQAPTSVGCRKVSSEEEG
jgi:hypothetical protein